MNERMTFLADVDSSRQADEKKIALSIIMGGKKPLSSVIA